ncbi:MAG: hypothetical protein JNL77_07030 [Nitrosomonas sp.]|nr:hypothetical protein [Nitrosomonas sp.]
MTTAKVKAFLPIDITDAMLVSSNLAEPGVLEPTWNSGSTYAEFDQVSVIAANSHLIYESLQSGNTNHPPATSKDWWILKSYTNRWRQFEWNRGSVSVGGSPMITTIRPGRRINAVVLIGLKAAVAEVIVQDGIGGAEVLHITQDLLARHALTHYEWAFLPFIYDTVFTTFDVPPVSDPVVTIRLTHPGGVCELGRLCVGTAVDLGEVEWNTVAEDENYSDITYEAGQAVFDPAPNMPGLELPIEIEAKYVNRALQFKELSNGKAVVWSAMHNIDAYRQMHVLIGPYQRFRISTDNHRLSSIALKIRGI